jgi:hypothetical protein
MSTEVREQDPSSANFSHGSPGKPGERPSSVRSSTLRDAIEQKRALGQRHTLREAIGIIVPLATRIADLHAQGLSFHVYPSAIEHGRAGSDIDLAAAAQIPSQPRDRACLAPEERKGAAGDTRASVFSIGAILYELVTGESVGPGMKRPTEAAPGLPPQLEVVLGKALVGDPKHRPSDLAALAQALHHLSPNASVAPPPADESHLDHDAGFDVDVSLSMIPPPPANGVVQAQPAPVSSPRSAPDPFAAVAAKPAARSPASPEDPTVKLAALKNQLESDPRPRYVVIKDGMDHGPFTAVELLQQIASHSFTGDHLLRDTLSEEERKIDDWEDFHLFAHQAKLNRDIKQERKALEAVVAGERYRQNWKILVGVGLLGIIGSAGVAWWSIQRGRSSNDQKVHDDKASNIDTDLALSAGKNGAKGGGAWKGGGSGSHPAISGGGSCEAAINAYTEDYTARGVPPDLGASDFGGVLNRGTYLNACGVPSNMEVSICAAVQGGRAVGVTVVTKPSNPGISSCISGAVRGLGFPSHPRMDVARTHFAAQ